MCIITVLNTFLDLLICSLFKKLEKQVHLKENPAGELRKETAQSAYVVNSFRKFRLPSKV